jgi:hypothetical protein
MPPGLLLGSLTEWRLRVAFPQDKYNASRLGLQRPELLIMTGEMMPVSQSSTISPLKEPRRLDIEIPLQKFNQSRRIPILNQIIRLTASH